MNKPDQLQHKKKCSGSFVLTLEIPVEYTVDAYWETYSDAFDNKYLEEDWEGDVDQVVEQNPHIKEFIKEAEAKGWKWTEKCIE